MDRAQRNSPRRGNLAALLLRSRTELLFLFGFPGSAEVETSLVFHHSPSSFDGSWFDGTLKSRFIDSREWTRTKRYYIVARMYRFREINDVTIAESISYLNYFDRVSNNRIRFKLRIRNMRIEMVNLCLLFLYYNAINVRNICKFGVLERIHLLILVRVKFMIAISIKKDLEK